MQTKLYVAYGSNINRSQMAYRCPGASYYATGVIKDYELQFKGYPNNSHATIEKVCGASVPVVVWNITETDEKYLDIYEGYPTYYQKEMVSVTLDDGSVVEAMVYVMDKSQSFGMPDKIYLRTIDQGYKDFGLDLDVLYSAVSIDTDTQQKYRKDVEEIDAEIRRRFPEPPDTL
ncbi:MAG: gamma-glutamylcyclotransferase [Clostridia bacterium]|nr:gamma-glutamylcyclotransferase [Clostridia bacterium]